MPDAAAYLAHYQAQGYTLPAGFTPERLGVEQARWSIRPAFMPLALAPGVIAWGVPFVDGKPLEHALLPA